MNSTRVNSPRWPSQSRKRDSNHLEPSSNEAKQARLNCSSQSRWHNEISEEIERLYDQKRQRIDRFNHKLALVDELYRAISTHPGYKDSGLFITGSSLNGFGETSSDLDLCLVVNFNQTINRSQALNHLGNVHKIIRDKFCQGGPIAAMRVIKAVCPILEFKHTPTRLDCDINVNNKVGIKNTFLLRLYSKCDPRIPALVIYLKCWCRFQNINSAVAGTLSSYTLTLLVLNYLQCGIPSSQPPLISSLQKTHPEVFPRSLTDMHPNPHVDTHSSNNRMSLADLLVGFFYHYTQRIRFDLDVMSVREANVVAIHEMRRLYDSHPPDCDGIGNRPDQWFKPDMFVEEPFNHTNAARNVSATGVAIIERKFRRAHQLLSQRSPILSLWNPL